MRSDFSRNTDGAALIEAALVLPILLALVLGLAELSLYFWRQSLAEQAVQLGLRRAVVSDAVAAGPGLNRADGAGYWDGRTAGAACTPEAGGPCPAFAVTCGGAGGCTCSVGRCGFTLSRDRLGPILDAMRAVLPELRPENLEIGYATNGLGYVGRPLPVPVDVTLRIVGLTYDTSFLGILFRSPIPIRASARSPSGDLASD